MARSQEFVDGGKASGPVLVELGSDTGLPPITVRRSKLLEFLFVRQRELEQFTNRALKRRTKGIRT